MAPLAETFLLTAFKGIGRDSREEQYEWRNYPGTCRANESGTGDELFIPKQEHLPIHKPQTFITNADPKQGCEQGSPPRSDIEVPRILSIGRPPRDDSIQHSVRSSQDEQHSLESQAQALQNGTISGLVEEERRLNKQIAEAKRLTNLYQRKDRIQAQLRERAPLEGEINQEDTT
ncbi:MAG: hypothetical protein Q9157_000617 [Trypethelium eluteriae]